ncbi:class I SAM-dependent methyltransferase [Glaciimonas sp. CA11.2]|uniref:class I SAM-dependent methyltransferase n=2 Tax=Glaciimonas sp. CA11.2 TaxID=3048601 RepID=UPI002AB55038|nr:class I SAM-dependent methyltransferase [Glaciimonas sp. CA11.2]MDY7544888.1 class I SAM-dependent methyltransferase [Glaciimonas sp. CA11.2]
MEYPSSKKSIIALGPWLQTPIGQYMLTWEQAHLDAMTADIFGFNAMQIGLPQMDTLRANRMRHKWLSDSEPLESWAQNRNESCNNSTSMQAAGQDQTHDQTQGRMETNQGQSKIVIAHDFADLPFASQSLDLVVLPHVLEFAAEPHQVLREVERVLIPEGQVIICGFNPASLWGIRQSTGRLSGAHFLPQNAEFISLLRLKDWLKLLNMEVNRGRFGCYAPPCATAKWLNRFSFMEKAGNRWWPYFGATYIVQAIKRVKGMHLIGPAFSKKAIKAANGVPATNRTHKAGKN